MVKQSKTQDAGLTSRQLSPNKAKEIILQALKILSLIHI